AMARWSGRGQGRTLGSSRARAGGEGPAVEGGPHAWPVRSGTTTGGRGSTLMVWTPERIDVDGLTAIDVHVHAGRSGNTPKSETSGPTRDDTLARTTARSGVGGQTPDETAAYYRERKIACAIWGVDVGGTRGGRPGAVSNDEMIEAAERNADVLIPF